MDRLRIRLMNIDLAALPDDVATLHRMIGELATTSDSGRVTGGPIWEVAYRRL